MKRKRASIALAPFVIFAGASFYEGHGAGAEAAAVHATVLELRATETRPFLALANSQDVIAVTDAYKCDWTCMQVLAKSRFAYAVQENDRWSVHRRQTGTACLTEETLDSHIEFLRFGFVDVCALAEPWNPAQNHIAVAETQSHPYGKGRLKGMYFDGSAFEAFEQIDGEKRLIGRWLRGSVRMPHRVSAFSWFTESKEDIGAHWENEEFLSALLGQQITMAIPAEWNNADAVMAALVPLFDDDMTRPKAIDAFALATQRAPESGDELLVTQAQLSMATGRRGQVIAGLSLISRLSRYKHPDVTFAVSHILSALGSDDEELIVAALRVAWAVPDDKAALARAAMWELAFSPLLDKEESPMRPLVDRLCEMPEPASVDLRQRAAVVLRAQSEPAPNLRTQAPLIVLAKGNADSRAAAMDVVLSLDGQAVAAAVRAISIKGWKCIAATPDDDWTRQELEAMVQRFRDIPADQLLHYYHALSRSEPFKDMTPLVRDILAARLSAAKSEANPDAREIRKLEELLKPLG